MTEILSNKAKLISIIDSEKIKTFGIKYTENSINIRKDDSVLDLKYSSIQNVYLDGDTVVLFMGNSFIRLFNEVLTVTY